MNLLEVLQLWPVATFAASFVFQKKPWRYAGAFVRGFSCMFLAFHDSLPKAGAFMLVILGFGLLLYELFREDEI